MDLRTCRQLPRHREQLSLNIRQALTQITYEFKISIQYSTIVLCLCSATPPPPHTHFFFFALFLEFRWIWRLQNNWDAALRRVTVGVRSGVFFRGAAIASRLSVAGGLLIADHVERRDSAYASGGVAEAGRARRSLRTGRSRDSRASCFALDSVLTVLADAWSTRGTWGWDGSLWNGNENVFVRRHSNLQEMFS